MTGGDTTGVVAVILACGVAVALIVLAVAAGWADQGEPTSTADTTLLSTVLGAGVGAIATYLGVRRAPPSDPERTIDQERAP